MEPTSTTSTVVIVAGETSGDLHGAKLVEAMRARAGDHLDFFGVGGPGEPASEF
jgi:lipid A disaccharide synthetase